MAKVSKIKKKIKGNNYIYWMIDARSLGLKQITTNPKTNKRFESKKEDDLYLAELLNNTSKSISVHTKDLLVTDICHHGEKEQIKD